MQLAAPALPFGLGVELGHLSNARGGSNVLHDHEQVTRIGRRRDKTEVPVECRGGIVLGMDGKRTKADDIGDLKGPAHGIEQKAGTDLLALVIAMNRKTAQNDEWDWVARHTLDDAIRRVRMADLAGHQGVVADDELAVQCNIRLC